MDKKKIEEYKTRLIEERQKIVANLGRTDDLNIVEHHYTEEADMANNHINQQLSLTIRDKEYKKLAQINLALEKIESGDFGYCDECGDEIGEKRLKGQPWAEFCIVHAEEREKKHA